MLAVMIIVWTVLAILFLTPLPRRRRRAGARGTMTAGLRLFSRLLALSGACELDLEAVDALRGGPPVILAPNHPTSLDAIFFLPRHPVGALTGSVAVIAHHAQAPIQVAVLESDSPCLGKGWPILKPPRLPIRCRVRRGRRPEAPAGTGACLEALRREYAAQLAQAPQRAWIGGP